MHVLVLTMVVMFSTFGILPSHLKSLPLSPFGATASGGEVGNVDLGRQNAIIGPISAPGSVRVPHEALHYTVQAGEDLGALSDKFHVSGNAIRWSNPDVLTHTLAIHQDQRLLIPPVEGVVATVAQDTTVQGLSDSFHVSPDAIRDFNYLKTDQLNPGRLLVVPGGIGPTLWPLSFADGQPHRGPYYNTFMPGQCTDFVASWVQVPWSGDAWMWYGGAQRAGWRTSNRWAPDKGAILVTWDSPYYGHVMLVTTVYQNGDIKVWEMNYQGPWIMDARYISAGQYTPGYGLIGFIYPPPGSEATP